MLWYLNFIVFFLLPSVRANDWDGFTDNLATDLAPLISLFGERLTKQFLSESIGVLDNFIFAVSPLGILTAVVSVIRVCGNSSLRAFVGRAQEGPGEAENELLSCVSENTAELFNDGGISRVIGRPRILEVVVWDEEGTENNEGSRKIGTLRDALQQNAWSVKDGEEFQDEKGYSLELDVPNLSLNKGIERRSQVWFHCAAVLGLALQTGVLAYAGLTVFLYPDDFEKDDEPVPSYAFPLFLFGTIFLCTGMFLCAFMIERASTEFYLHPNKPSKIYWLQPGKQDVGHQPFGAFLGVTEGPESYIKSIRDRGHNSKGSLLVIAIAITMVGFVVQFVGLRGLHASVILAQMGSTLLMAIVRTCLRTKRIGPDENRLDPTERQLSSYKHQELDSFAFHLEDVESFSLISTAASGPLPSQSSSSSSASSIESSIQQVGTGTRLVQTRARLAELTSNTDEHPDRAWEDLPIRLAAQNLARTIEMTMDLLSTWREVPRDTESFDLSFVCQSRKKFVAPKVEAYNITIERSNDTLQWHVNDRDLEAIVGLRTWSLLKTNEKWQQEKLYRLVGLSEAEAREEETDLYFHKWIYRHTEARMAASNMISFPQQMFGYESSEHTDDKEILVVKTANALESMVAQDIYIQFLSSALQDLRDLGGVTEVIAGPQNRFIALNSRIDELVDCFESGVMGSREDALLCMIPVLGQQHLLPELAADSSDIITRIDKLVANDKWEEAFSICRWLCERCAHDEFKRSAFETGYLCQRALLHSDRKTRQIGIDQVCSLLESDIRTNHSNGLRGIRRPGWMESQSQKEWWDMFSQQLGWIAWHICDEKTERHAMKSDLEAFGVGAANDINLSADPGNHQAEEQNAKETLLGWLTRGIDIEFYREVPGSEDQKCLEWVLQNEKTALCHWLLIKWAEVGQSYSQLILKAFVFAAKIRSDFAIQTLRRHDADINTYGPEGYTALLELVSSQDREGVERLLSNGADPNVCSLRNRIMPLSVSASQGDETITSLLLDNGAIMELHDEAGFTALHTASRLNQLSTTRLLLERGADIETIAKDGKTPLIYAASDNHYEMIELLLDMGANVHAEDSHGATALMRAAQDSSDKIVRLLLDRNSDPSRENYNGRTAFDYARDMQRMENMVILDAAIRASAVP